MFFTNKPLVQNWLYVGWVFFPGLAFISPTVQIWKNFFYAMVLLPWLLLLPRIYTHFVQSKKNKAIQANVLISVCCLYWTLSTLWSSELVEGFIFYFKQFIYVTCYLSVSIFLAYHYSKLLKHVFLIIVVCGFFSLFLSIYVYLSEFDIYAAIGVGWERRLVGFGILQNPLVAAQSYGMLLLISIFLILNNQNNKEVILLVALSMLTFLLIVWTRSRGPVLFLVPMVIWLLLQQTRYRQILALSMLGLALIIVTVLFFVPDFRDTIFNRGLSIDYRMKIWLKAWHEIIQNPIIGTGAHKVLVLETPSETYFHAHSIWLHTLLYSGFIGLLAAFVSLGYVIWVGVKSSLTSIHVILLVFGVLCLSSNGHFILSRPGWQWHMLWIPIAFILADRTLNVQKT